MRSGAAVSVLLALAFAAPAAAEQRSATLTDNSSDAQGPPELVSAKVTYDTNGSVEGRITYATAPAAGSTRVVALVLGEIDGSRCVRDGAIGAYADAPNGTSSWSRRGSSGQGTARIEGSTLVVNASAPGLAGDVDCALVEVAQRGANDENVVTDRIDPVALSLPDGDGDGVPDRADRCPTQGAATSDGCPPPPPTPPTPPTPPKPEPTEPVPPKPVATALERYDAAVARCPRRSGRARKRCLSRVAKANRAGAALARKRKKNPFLGKAFLTVDPDVAGVCGGSCVTGWVFADDRWAYRGVPEDGPGIPRCTAVTAVGDKDGCLRYRLSRNGKTATIGSATFTVSGTKLSFRDGTETDTFTQVAVPPAGSRYAAVLDSISSFGIPGVNQSFSTSHLVLAADGRFTTSGTVSGTTGQNTDLETNYAGISADRKGTYAFEPGGTLALMFADGRVTRRSAYVMFGDNNTLGSVPKDGLLLDGSAYLPDDD